jgi:hypothetical protein
VAVSWKRKRKRKLWAVDQDLVSPELEQLYREVVDGA